MAADGSVLIEANLNVDRAEKNLEKLKRSIEKTEGEISKTRSERDKADREGVFKAAELDAEKAKLQEMRNELQRMRDITKDKSFSEGVRVETKMAIPGMKADVADQAARVRMLQADYNKVAASVERYDRELSGATAELDRQKNEAGALIKQINSVSAASRKMAEAQERAANSARRFKLRISEVVRSALLFTLITQALAEFREWMGKVVQTNAEATAAFTRLKGALLTLAQPLVEVIIPALVTFLNVLTRVVSVAAQLVSFLFGKTASQSQEAAKGLNKQTEALKGVGSAADDAAGSLAGFDEINKLSGGGAGGSTTAATAPDFRLDFTATEDQMKNLLGVIAAIGSAFLSWKLGSGFLNSLQIFTGMMFSVGGAVMFAKNLWDAWQNGISMENLLGMLAGCVLLATGLGIAFGHVAAGIGLIVTGIALLTTGFSDAMEHGWNFHNMLGVIAGLLITGLGIGVLTGSWIPLLIAGIASSLLALTVATGHGEELINGIKKVCQGFVDFIAGIFTGDIDRALTGVAGIFDGLGVVVGSVIDGMRDTLLGFLDWLDEKTGGRFHQIIETAKGFVTGFFDQVKNTASGAIDAVKQIFQGIIKFVSGVFTNDWNMAWCGIKDVFRGVINGVISIWEGGINLIIRGLNWLIKQANKIRFDFPDWIPGVGGKNFGINIPTISEKNIPRLATGSVIPPNREFMAILGDNKTETEVVSPLSTMKQAFMEAMQESGGFGGGTYKFEIYINGRKMAVEMVKEVNNLTIEAGKPVLLF